MLHNRDEAEVVEIEDDEKDQTLKSFADKLAEFEAVPKKKVKIPF